MAWEKQMAKNRSANDRIMDITCSKRIRKVHGGMNVTRTNSNPETPVFVGKNMLKRLLGSFGEKFPPGKIQIKKALPVGRALEELDGLENY